LVDLRGFLVAVRMTLRRHDVCAERIEIRERGRCRQMQATIETIRSCEEDVLREIRPHE
jgi:hypothetical protein